MWLLSNSPNELSTIYSITYSARIVTLLTTVNSSYLFASNTFLHGFHVFASVTACARRGNDFPLLIRNGPKNPTTTKRYQSRLVLNQTWNSLFIDDSNNKSVRWAITWVQHVVHVVEHELWSHMCEACKAMLGICALCVLQEHFRFFDSIYLLIFYDHWWLFHSSLWSGQMYVGFGVYLYITSFHGATLPHICTAWYLWYRSWTHNACIRARVRTFSKRIFTRITKCVGQNALPFHSKYCIAIRERHDDAMAMDKFKSIIRLRIHFIYCHLHPCLAWSNYDYTTGKWQMKRTKNNNNNSYTQTKLTLWKMLPPQH